MATLATRAAYREARRDKDSHNSGKPPSRDGLATKPVSLRPHTGRVTVARLQLNSADQISGTIVVNRTASVPLTFTPRQNMAHDH